MTTALYRRYRPETFAEMIGQAQVTEPLTTALRGDRVGHAYLFSGPRGCGKTTSARILARCLNCAQGPTDTPCGQCDSCAELGRGGGGSLDVVEIDAASHNGVDDARDLRERAIFAPARDRYKIFILDEAHMVTQQGFNALLKLVEEPPDHVKFIFATTEPEKVLGTIRSRTHHYPFRLVPPAAMLEYVQQLCEQEGVRVEKGVLPLVVRAGGGSPRDTLSLLDQLIAGSAASASSGQVTVGYELAVALLGYTHAELLDEVIDAFAAADAATAFTAIDRVVQTGQDPRRFVDDLLERLRDLIIVEATGTGAAAVLRGVSAEELERMSRQADAFGAERLSRTADLVVAALDEMTGATSPRLQLELMVARVLTHTAAPAAATAVVERGAERAETKRAEPTVSRAPVPAPPAPVSSAPASSAPVSSAPVPGAPVPGIATADPEPVAGPVTLQSLQASWPSVIDRLESIRRASWMVAMQTRPLQLEETDDGHVLTLAFPSAKEIEKFKPKALGGTDAHVDVRQAIKDVAGITVRFLPRVDPSAGSENGSGGAGGDTDAPPPPDEEPSPHPPSAHPSAGPPASSRTGTGTGTGAGSGGGSGSGRAGGSSAPRTAGPVTDWAVAPIPGDGSAPVAAVAQFAVDDEPEDAAAPGIRIATLAPARDGDVVADADDVPDDPDDADVDILGPAGPADPGATAPATSLRTSPGLERYGEAVVRQVLGARFVREEPYEPPTRFQ
ncbi:MAG TPA: DNA polymerase III subunit gamma and tau [Microbacterium sp.]|nr:DNA polymerase III subunit gamma and tau [Microbacterium sp.]